jgi:hypothetical protein
MDDKELDALEKLVEEGREEKEKRTKEKMPVPEERRSGFSILTFIEGEIVGVILMVIIVALIHLGVR